MPSTEPALSAQRSGITPLVPARLVDTRTSGATVDGDQAAGGTIAGSSFAVRVAGRGGVPASGARAVWINFTVVDPDQDGYATVYPGDQALPVSSNMNYAGKTVTAAQSVVLLGPSGTVNVYVSAQADLIVDVVGWVDATAPSTVLTPARLVDSRRGAETADGQFNGFGTLGAGRTLPIDVLGRGGVPSSGVGAVIVSIAAVSPTDAGFITVHPDGESRPNSSNLNFGRGETRANEVVAKLGANGRVALYTDATTDVIVDVLAWVPAGSDMHALTPERLVDTRSVEPAGTGPIRAGTSIEVNIAGSAGMPSDQPGSVMINVTAIGRGSAGYLTVYPAGQQVPNASSLNFTGGQVVANQVLAQLGRHGRIRIFSPVDVDVIVDVLAWLPPGTNQAATNVVNLSDRGDTSFTSGGRGTGAATFEMPTGADLATSDVVVLFDAAGLPYYGRVDSVTGTVVSTKEVSLGEVIPAGSFSFNADAETGAIDSGATGVNQPLRYGSAAIATRALELPPDFGVARRLACSGGGSASANIDVTVDLLKFHGESSWGFLGPKVELYYNPTLTFSAESQVDLAGSCTLSFPLTSKKLPTLRFSIGAIPIVITQDVDLSVGITIAAADTIRLTAGLVASAKVGVRYDNGLSPIHEFTVDRKLSIGVGKSTQLTVGLTAAYSAALYGMLAVVLSVTPLVTLSYEPNERKWLSATAQVDGEIGVEMHINIAGVEFSTSLVKATTTMWGPNEIFSRTRGQSEIPVYPTPLTQPRIGRLFTTSFKATLPLVGPDAVWSAVGLPPGLSITGNGATAVLSGTPTQEGFYKITVNVEQADDLGNDALGQYTFTVKVPTPPSQIDTWPAEGETGNTMTGFVEISGGIAPFKWTSGGFLTFPIDYTVTGSNKVSGIAPPPGTGTTTATVTDTAGQSIPLTVSWVSTEPISITTVAVPAADGGSPYAATIQLAGGATPLGITVTGLPSSLHWDQNGRTITISGTLATSMVGTTYDVVVTAVSNAVSGSRASQTFPINVRPKLLLSKTVVPMPIAGKALTDSDGWLAVAGGTSAPYSWNVTGLPSGVTFDRSQATRRVRLRGSLSAATAANISVAVTDSLGSTANSTNVQLIGSDVPSVLETALPATTVGEPYDTTLTLTGGTPSYTATMVGLPSGVTFATTATPGMYRISGTPTTAALYNAEVVVSDASARAALRFARPIRVATRVRVDTSNLPDGTSGLAYPTTGAFTAAGGVAPYSWSMTGLSDLTLTVDSADSSKATVSGTPQTPGTYDVTVRVNDALGIRNATYVRTVTIRPPLALDVTAMPSKAYTYQDIRGSASATGGGGNTQFTAVGLPNGVSMGLDGRLIGRPTTGGDSTATITATDSQGTTVSNTVTIGVRTPVTISASSIPNSLALNSPFSGRLSASGGVGPYTFSWTYPSNTPTWITSAWTGSGFSNGTVGSDGTWALSFTVTDADGRTATANATVTSKSWTDLGYTMTERSGATTFTVGQKYTFDLTVTGGTPGFTSFFAGCGDIFYFLGGFDPYSTGGYQIPWTVDNGNFSPEKRCGADVSAPQTPHPFTSVINDYGTNSMPTAESNRAVLTWTPTAAGTRTISPYMQGWRQGLPECWFWFPYPTKCTNRVLVDEGVITQFPITLGTAYMPLAINLPSSWPGTGDSLYAHPNSSGIDQLITVSAGKGSGNSLAVTSGIGTVSQVDATTFRYQVKSSTPGTFPVTFRATDGDGRVATVDTSFTLVDPPTLTVTGGFPTAEPTVTPKATDPGSSFTFPIFADGGIGSYGVSFPNGKPAALNYTQSGNTFTFNTGWLGAWATGTYTVDIRVYDSFSRTADTSVTFTILPRPFLSVTGTPDKIYFGSTYASLGTVTASGGTLPYQFSADGLPGGLNIDQATGDLSGTPSQTMQNAVVTVKVTDAKGYSATTSFTVTIYKLITATWGTFRPSDADHWITGSYVAPGVYVANLPTWSLRVTEPLGLVNPIQTSMFINNGWHYVAGGAKSYDPVPFIVPTETTTHQSNAGGSIVSDEYVWGLPISGANNEPEDNQPYSAYFSITSADGVWYGEWQASAYWRVGV